MKNTRIFIIILFLSLSASSQACWWQDEDDWWEDSSWWDEDPDGSFWFPDIEITPDDDYDWGIDDDWWRNPYDYDNDNDWNDYSNWDEYWDDYTNNNNSNDSNSSYMVAGQQALNKITSDLARGNVNVQQVKISNGQAVLTAAGVGVNTNGIITSCLHLIKGADKVALGLGKAMAGVGIGIGTAQTIVGLCDGSFSANDALNILSLTLGIAAVIVTGPGLGAALGVGSCIVGLISIFVTQQTLIEVELEEGGKIYLFFT